MGSRILGVECANPLNEGLHASLLKDAHERRLEGFASIRGHLGNSGLVRGTLLNVAAGNLLEFEISGYVGGDENIGQLSGGHEELGNEINVPVVESAVVLPWLFTGLEVSVLLKELYALRRCQNMRDSGAKESRRGFWGDVPPRGSPMQLHCRPEYISKTLQAECLSQDIVKTIAAHP